VSAQTGQNWHTCLAQQTAGNAFHETWSTRRQKGNIHRRDGFTAAGIT
jgi:hypothetical protein